MKSLLAHRQSSKPLNYVYGGWCMDVISTRYFSQRPVPTRKMPQWWRPCSLDKIKQKVGSGEVTLSPLNLHHYIHHCTFVYDFTTTLSLQGSNPICTLTSTVHIVGVSFLTVHAYLIDFTQTKPKVHPETSLIFISKNQPGVEVLIHSGALLAAIHR